RGCRPRYHGRAAIQQPHRPPALAPHPLPSRWRQPAPEPGRRRGAGRHRRQGRGTGARRLSAALASACDRRPHHARRHSLPGRRPLAGMALLLDDFGLLSVLLHGGRLLAQSLTLGGIGFMAVLARPLAGELGASGALILQRSRRLLGWSAAALAVAQA